MVGLLWVEMGSSGVVGTLMMGKDKVLYQKRIYGAMKRKAA
jgi:hypothetical protein